MTNDIRTALHDLGRAFAAFRENNDERLRDVGRRAFELGPSPRGFMRQFAAIAFDGDRTRRLAAVRAPTVVIHGEEDPLIPLAAGRATARAIAGAWWVPIAGLGHDLPRALWPRIIDAIAMNTKRA